MIKKYLIVVICSLLFFAACTKEQKKVNTALDINNLHSVYQILIYSFADSNGDGLGDFKGITNKLPYLQSLGVDAIWLSPLHPATSYHGYDVTDYLAVNPQYGTIDDLKELLKAAHAAKIKVIMDMVFNHTSREHPWFTSAKAGDKKYRAYYQWLDNKVRYPLGSQGWHALGDSFYYGAFWEGMPDLNLDNKNVRREISSICKYWLDLGVDGFRLDAVPIAYDGNEYPRGTNLLEKNINWWRLFDQQVKSVNPSAYTVGEVWLPSTRSNYYYAGFDSLFNFDLNEKLLNLVNRERADDFVDQLVLMDASFRETRPDYRDAIFLSNHDQNRIASSLQGDSAKLKLTQNILYSLSGTVYIYYGEELGMLGKKPDEKIREPFVWGANDPAQTHWESLEYNADTPPESTQESNSESLLNRYKNLIHLRKQIPALENGRLRNFPQINTEGLLAYVKDGAHESVIVVHNLINKKITISLEGLPGEEYILLGQDNKNSFQAQQMKDVKSITLAGYSSVLIVHHQ